MNHWTPAQTAAAQAASGAAWRQRAAEILPNHNATTDEHDPYICKLCGRHIFSHTTAAAPAEPEPPLSPEEEEMLF
jgi:hypothetical protein